MQTNLLDDSLTQEPLIAPKILRIVAVIIDFIIFWCVGMLLGYLFGQPIYQETGNVGFSLTGFPAFLLIVAGFILFPVMEGITGQTIGKRVLSIKVVKENNENITFINSFIRHLLDCIDCIFLVGLIVASSNKKKQRIGDLVAKTIVVKK